MATGTIKKMQSQIEIFEVITSGSCTANGITVLATSAEKSGYKAVGIAGFYVNGISKGAVRSVYLQDLNEDGTSQQASGSVVFEIYNGNNAAQTATCRAHIMYIKT